RRREDPGPRDALNVWSFALLALGPGSRFARAKRALAALVRDTRENRGADMTEASVVQTSATSAEVARIPPSVLAACVRRAFQAAGLSAADAEQVAALMVEADLRGSDTH